jgi:isocitrate dehydrogenase
VRTAANIMTKNVINIRPDATVADAVQKMKEHDVSSLLVRCDDAMHTWGFMTETDVIEKVVAQELDPTRVTVKEIMSKPVITVPPQASLQECASLLARADIRRVLVYDGKEFVGIVSSTDIFNAL